jgi:hypothetical protein
MDAMRAFCRPSRDYGLNKHGVHAHLSVLLTEATLHPNTRRTLDYLE